MTAADIEAALVVASELAAFLTGPVAPSSLAVGLQ